MGAILAVGGVNGTVCKARAPRTEGGHSMHQWLDQADLGLRKVGEIATSSHVALSFSPG